MQDTMEHSDSALERSPDWRDLIRKFAFVMVAWAVVIHAFAQVFIPPVALFGALFVIGAVLVRRSSGKAGPDIHDRPRCRPGGRERTHHHGSTPLP